MQPTDRAARHVPLRVLAAVLVCALGLVVGARARAGATVHKRSPHAASAVVTAFDSAPGQVRHADAHGLLSVGPAEATLVRLGRTPDSSTTASSHPAVTSPARGPPEQPA